MRKVLSLMLVVLVMFSSCEMNEDNVATPEKVGKISINAIVNTSASTSFKSTIVERGDVPVYVKGVDVTVTGISSGYAVSEQFLYEIGGIGNMLIENTALGQNSIDAVSIPTDGILPHTFIGAESAELGVELLGGMISIATQGVQYQSFYKWYGEVAGEVSFFWWTIEFHKHLKDGTVPVDAMSDFISFIIANERDQNTGAPIYAVYTGSTQANVIYSNPALVDVSMTTNNGRQMVTFTVDNLDMLDLYDVNVVGYCPTSPQEDAGGLSDGVILNETTPFAISYWSDAAAVDGANTEYTVEFTEKGSNVVLRSIPVTVSVTAGVSMWTNVVITESAFYTDEQALTFTYDPLTELDENVIID